MGVGGSEVTGIGEDRIRTFVAADSSAGVRGRALWGYVEAEQYIFMIKSIHEMGCGANHYTMAAQHFILLNFSLILVSDNSINSVLVNIL